MKKLLGISLIAILTAAPTFAALPNVSVPGTELNPTITPTQMPLASQSYVQGAYKDAVNTAIAYTNAENSRATSVEGSLNNLDVSFVGNERDNLVSAINATKLVADTNTQKIGADQNGYVLTLGGTNYNTVSSALSALSNNVSGNYADQNLSNLTNAGELHITNNVLTNAKDGSFTGAVNSNIQSNTLQGAINEVAAEYQAADAVLQNAIETEAQDRATAVSAEASARAAADTALGQRIDNITSDFATINGVNNSSVATSGTVSVVTEWDNPNSVTNYTINATGTVSYNNIAGAGSGSASGDGDSLDEESDFDF